MRSVKMNRKLFVNAIRKMNGKTIFLFLFLTIGGLFIQHCFLSAEAAKEKWEFCTRFDGDGYGFICNSDEGKPVQVKGEWLQEAKTYTVESFRLKGDFSAYQYSAEVWDFLSYELKEGDGFQPGNVNQIIVSQGMADRYPLGSSLELIFYSGPLKEEVLVECEIVGVLEPEEILFPHHTEQGAMLWNKNDSFSQMTMKSKFIVLNPEQKLPEMDKCVRERTFFLNGDSFEKNEWKETLSENGTLISFKEAYDKTEPERTVSVALAVRAAVCMLAAVVALLVWTYAVVKKCEDDSYYLLKAGFSRKQLFGTIAGMYGFLLLVSFVLSFLAYVLPHEYEDSWHMAGVAPLAALAGYVLVWGVSSGLVWVMYHNHTFETDMHISYIEDLSLLDNICLCLLAHGYSPKAAAAVAGRMLEEKEIAFCAKRKMGMLAMEQKICFSEIMSELCNQ